MGETDMSGQPSEAHDPVVETVGSQPIIDDSPALLAAPLPSTVPPTDDAIVAEPTPFVPSTPPAQPPLSSLAWHLVGAVVFGVATVLVLALGPIILALLGPDWLGWLVWPIGALTAWRMVRHLQGLAQARVEWAAGAALVIGLTLGMGWAVAAEVGWMPPLLTSGLRPAATAPPPAPTSISAGFRVGVRVRVVETGGAGLRVRSAAGVDTAPVGFLPEDAEARIISGPQLADSFRWWEVEGEGVTGWVADAWLHVE